MHKTTLLVDDDRIAQAAEALGTRGIRSTINAALDEVIAQAARRRSLEQLKSMEGLELNDAEVMRQAWR